MVKPKVGIASNTGRVDDKIEELRFEFCLFDRRDFDPDVVPPFQRERHEGVRHFLDASDGSAEGCAYSQLYHSSQHRLQRTDRIPQPRPALVARVSRYQWYEEMREMSLDEIRYH